MFVINLNFFEPTLLLRELLSFAVCMSVINP